MFSGIGGFDLALRNLNHTIVGACEIDRYARQVYGRHFPGIKIYENATTIKPEELPDFDILAAGFPCQAFSIAGKRRGFNDTRGSLFFEIARVAKEKRPSILLLENVKGLLSHDKGNTFKTIINTLDEIGYDAEWQVLNSKYFVPQNRERIFIIGHFRGERTRQIFPLGDYDQKTDRKIKKVVANYAKGGGTRTMIKAVSIENTGANGRRIKDDGDPQFTLSQSCGVGVLFNEPKLKRVEGKPNVYNTDAQAGKIYDKSGISPTVSGQRTNSQGWVNTKKIRRLTPVECERLQGFPDNWTKYDNNGKEISNTQRYKMCGNAVTVPVIEYIISNYLL